MYAREAQQVRHSTDTCFSSHQAIERVQSIRESFSLARPYSASVLAYGEVFTYAEGYLCYVNGPHVRVVNIRSTSKVEEVVDVLAINQKLAGPSKPGRPALSANETRITSISYSEGVLACVCRTEIKDEDWLLIIDMGLQDHKDSHEEVVQHRPPLRWRLSCTTKLFIRHTRKYLYFGTHSGLRSDGHHEWLLMGLNLETRSPVVLKPLQLVDFVGSDIGSTACFRIHEACLYAVSNQTSFETEEVDWTSYYNCIKITLGDTKPDLRAHPFWQRQHGEGPINDSWTDLSLQKDEQTNELLIVECRKEWLGGGTANIRTYYTQPLRFNTEDEIIETSKFPANDIMTKTLSENSKPHFSEPRKRIRKHYHHEYEYDGLNPGNSGPADFILAKTKFRAYNPSAMSFIDLVNDPAPVRPGSARMRDRLRLRIASRKQQSPFVDDPHNPDQKILRQPELDEHDNPIPGSEQAFHPTVIHFFPPDNAPAELYDVLCTLDRVGNIDAIADERSIVYMADSPHADSDKFKPIVMISFDPKWGRGLRIPTMPSPSSSAGHSIPAKDMQLELTSSSKPSSKRRLSPATAEPSTTSHTASLPARPQPKRQKRDGDDPSAPPTQPEKHPRHIWREDAMYLAINRGYRIEYADSPHPHTDSET
jgi:hypothetical protein